jgi:hypothetical protein
MDEAVYDNDDDEEEEDHGIDSEDGHLGRRGYLGSDGDEEDEEDEEDGYMYAALHRGVGADGGRGGAAAGNRAAEANELEAMLVEHMPQVCTRQMIGAIAVLLDERAAHWCWLTSTGMQRGYHMPMSGP